MRHEQSDPRRGLGPHDVDDSIGAAPPPHGKRRDGHARLRPAVRRGRGALGGVGVIHDWDYESGPTLDLHPMRGINMLREKGWPEDVLDDIASHALYLDVPRDRP